MVCICGDHALHAHVISICVHLSLHMCKGPQQDSTLKLCGTLDKTGDQSHQTTAT